jgi:O-antigen/teichoic acid export membrane protein
MNFSYWALVIPSIVSALITFLAYSSRLKVSLLAPDWSSIRETLKTSKELITNVSGYRVLVYCVRNFDNIVVSKIFGLKILGLYSRAFNMAALPVQIITGVSNDIQYSMLADLKKHGEERVRQEFAQFLRLLGIIGFPVVMVFQIWGHEFSRFVWGRNWNDVGDYLSPLSILIPTNLILYSVSAIFLLERKEKLLFRNSLISAFGIMSGILIGSFISLKGVIVGLLLGNLFFTIPITGYNVLYKVMKYPIGQIIRVWGINWLIAVLLTAAFIFNLQLLKLIVIGCYGLLFIIRGINYYRLNLVNTR